ncbi:hypothetical protein [Myroides sp. LoEW2-1]|nr:hypothetical protein [Myroides sp. LoEW2-1]
MGSKEDMILIGEKEHFIANVEKSTTPAMVVLLNEIANSEIAL